MVKQDHVKGICFYTKQITQDAFVFTAQIPDAQRDDIKNSHIEQVNTDDGVLGREWLYGCPPISIFILLNSPTQPYQRKSHDFVVVLIPQPVQ